MKREKAKKESATKETMADEASPIEQMYGAIMAVKDLLDSPEHTSGPVVHGTGALGEENVKRLLAIGCLKEVLDGWYIIRFSPEDCGPADWCRAYWHFIVAYLNDKFGDDWCLSPDCSLDFNSESTLIPDQLVVRSGKAGGKIVRLPYDSSILEVKADVPEDVEKDPKYGVHLYPLHVALLAASKDYYKTHPIEARVCLAMLTNTVQVVDAALKMGYQKPALRVASGLRAIGRDEMADVIREMLQEEGYGTDEEPAFDEELKNCIEGHSPVANRIRLMWKVMRTSVVEAKDYLRYEPHLKSVEELMDDLADAFVEESANTIILDKYEETVEMLKALSSPSEAKMDAQETDEGVLAARGFRLAFDKVRQDVFDSLTGGDEISRLCARHLEDWNYMLFQPGVRAGVLTAREYAGYRDDPCSSIPGCIHIPFHHDDIGEALYALSQMLQLEEDTIVRAVLGHFFLLYIQPFPNGNVETARFIMNSQLVASGYPWATVYHELLERYTEALQTAIMEEDILPFALLAITLINNAK